MKISTILRRACEWSAEHKQKTWINAFEAATPDYAIQERALDFCCSRFCWHLNFSDDPGARSIMLGLAAAIAESEGL